MRKHFFIITYIEEHCTGPSKHENLGAYVARNY